MKSIDYKGKIGRFESRTECQNQPYPIEIIEPRGGIGVQVNPAIPARPAMHSPTLASRMGGRLPRCFNHLTKRATAPAPIGAVGVSGDLASGYRPLPSEGTGTDHNASGSPFGPSANRERSGKPQDVPWVRFGSRRR